ncbi:Trk system potassium transporter TrkA [Oceanithermus sp.]|uniref:Trk system potassium transporter TrkA n=1 Tax=Oceanithermus sp. TaxID=2268145 RepID=UPI0025FA191A|nr:Trk system potassium transporter TrkA [Oceanithermus sp.]
MYIVIAGGGDIGALIAQSLHNDHDVVIIDRNAAVVDRMSALDVRVIVGNATDPEILREAGVDQADAFIATTNSDEVNLIASMLAKGLGAAQSLTFLGKAYYVEVLTDPRTMEILGTRIDRVFWPQRALAKEVLEVVLIPKALDTEVIAGGRLRLIEYMIDADSSYAHRLARDLDWPRGVKLLGVLREGQFITPHDPDFRDLVLEPGDHLVFVTTQGGFPVLHSLFAGSDRVRRVFIVGGGTVGYMIAKRLRESRVEVVLIEQDAERCEFLSEELSGVLVIQGDGTDISLLEQEGLESADALIAVTDNDEKNLLVSLLAKQLGVEKVVTRVSRSETRILFERVGVDIPLTPRQAAVREVIAYLAPEGVERLALIEDAVEVIEVQVPPELDGTLLEELDLPPHTTVVAAMRGWRVVLATEELRLKAGDELILMASREEVAHVAERFKGG